MTTSKIPTLRTYSLRNQKQQENHIPRCTLKWRQGQLLVSLDGQSNQPCLPTIENKQWLVECLKRSPVRLIRIDPDLGEASLKFWVQACEQANKVIFLRLRVAQKLPLQRRPQNWWPKRLIDWMLGFLLLLLLSPLMLGLVCLMRTQSPDKPIFSREWCVGERGKLFRLFKFRTMDINAQMLEQEMMGNKKSLYDQEEKSIAPLERWMRKYGLDKLPQLFNVLRGEMSLVGRHPWTVYDAVRLNPEGRQQLRALPGVVLNKKGMNGVYQSNFSMPVKLLDC